jgi:hypothetical protein
MPDLATLRRRPHLRHLQRFDADAAPHVEHRAYSHGYTDGFDAALELPADHPLLDGIKEKLRAEGWNEPGEVQS